MKVWEGWVACLKTIRSFVASGAPHGGQNRWWNGMLRCDDRAEQRKASVIVGARLLCSFAAEISPQPKSCRIGTSFCFTSWRIRLIDLLRAPHPRSLDAQLAQRIAEDLAPVPRHSKDAENETLTFQTRRHFLFELLLDPCWTPLTGRCEVRHCH